MRSFRFFKFPLIVFIALTIASISNHGCKPDDEVQDDDGFCDTCIMVYKPNIYIYPEQETELYVTLDFPKGGKVVTSIPEYGNGWNVTVDKTGLINGSYNYLFYESSQPDVWQLTEGWIVKREDLKTFFVENMAKYGFVENEINDFTDYWIPLFATSGFYEIYPQNQQIIESVIQLDVSKRPDNLLRLFYVIIESKHSPGFVLPEPKIDKTLTREGFFITEWGVVLK